MVKTICIPEELHKELVMLKLNHGIKIYLKELKNLLLLIKN